MSDMDVALREMRERAGLTQQDVAYALDIRQSTVSMWETAESRPRAGLLPQIAALYRCTVGDLFNAKGGRNGSTAEPVPADAAGSGGAVPDQR